MVAADRRCAYAELSRLIPAPSPKRASLPRSSPQLARGFFALRECTWQHL